MNSCEDQMGAYNNEVGWVLIWSWGQSSSPILLDEPERWTSMFDGDYLDNNGFTGDIPEERGLWLCEVKLLVSGRGHYESCDVGWEFRVLRSVKVEMKV